MTSTVAGYFAAPAAEGTFSSIPAQGEARLTGLSVGTHLLVGFFTEPGTDDFPVRVITLRADSTVGERFYGIFASPAQLTVRRGVGRLSQIAQVPADSGTGTHWKHLGAGAQASGAQASGAQTGGEGTAIGPARLSRPSVTPTPRSSSRARPATASRFSRSRSRGPGCRQEHGSRPSRKALTPRV